MKNISSDFIYIICVRNVKPLQLILNIVLFVTKIKEKIKILVKFK